MKLAGKYSGILPKGAGNYVPTDPRDFLVDPYLWASQLLPLGVSIDQAIKEGIWPQRAVPGVAQHDHACSAAFIDTSS